MRDILLFPKFNNINLIEEVREKKDALYKVIKPHITIVFPFDDKISNEELIKKLEEIICNVKSFEVEFSGVSKSFDNYIYLNCIKGSDNIIMLHDLIYHNILSKHLRSDIEYIPHITMGQGEDISELNDFNYLFKCKIDKIYIEEIGSNEESIIIKEIELGE